MGLNTQLGGSGYVVNFADEARYGHRSAGSVVRRSAAQSASGTAVSTPTLLAGIMCTASAAGVITVYDNTSAAGAQVLTSLALVANQFYPVAGPALMQMDNGVHVVLVSGAATFYVCHRPPVV